MDWGAEKAALFLDGEFIANTWFFTHERDKQTECDSRFVNALSLYTLTPG